MPHHEGKPPKEHGCGGFGVACSAKAQKGERGGQHQCEADTKRKKNGKGIGAERVQGPLRCEDLSYFDKVLRAIKMRERGQKKARRGGGGRNKGYILTTHKGKVRRVQDSLTQLTP